MLEIEYELRKQDLTAFTEHQLQDKEHYQRILRRHQITFPAILALLAFFVWFYYANILGTICIALIAVLWHYLSPLLIKYSIRHKTFKLYSDADKEQLIGKYKLRLEPQALAEIRGKQEIRIPWRDILRIEAAKRYVFIYLDVDIALIIPRKTAKGDLHKFIQIADKRISSSE
ncbi:MAG: YcxB family protein [Methylohalobius sp.]|nr:YcxB family protein [Methylohalobius sp.]